MNSGTTVFSQILAFIDYEGAVSRASSNEPRSRTNYEIARKKRSPRHSIVVRQATARSPMMLAELLRLQFSTSASVAAPSSVIAQGVAGL